jgi:hypothetical protein
VSASGRRARPMHVCCGGRAHATLGRWYRFTARGLGLGAALGTHWRWPIVKFHGLGQWDRVNLHAPERSRPCCNMSRPTALLPRCPGGSYSAQRGLDAGLPGATRAFHQIQCFCSAVPRYIELGLLSQGWAEWSERPGCSSGHTTAYNGYAAMSNDGPPDVQHAITRLTPGMHPASTGPGNPEMHPCGPRCRAHPLQLNLGPG